MPYRTDFYFPFAHFSFYPVMGFSMVTRICRYCLSITEHQTAADVKGRVVCSRCGKMSVLLTERQAGDLVEKKKEMERNEYIDLQCPKCKYRIIGRFKGKIYCPQCHSLWKRYDNDDGVVIDKNWEERIMFCRKSDAESRDRKFKETIRTSEIFNSGVLYFRPEKIMTGDEIGNTLCPLCNLFREKAYVTTIRDIIAHEKALPPFKSCRCPVVSGVSMDACYPAMRDKPDNVEFVDLDSVIETVELYKQACSGSRDIPFESRLKIIPEKEYIEDYQKNKIGKISGTNKKRRHGNEKPKIGCFNIFIVALILYLLARS